MFKTHYIHWSFYFYSFLISLSISLLVTKVLVTAFKTSDKVQRFIGSLPHIHNKVMTFGGAGVVLSFIATIWTCFLFGWIHDDKLFLLQILTLALCLTFALGILDDIFDFTARTKFSVQIFIITIVYLSGFKMPQIGDIALSDPASFFLVSLWICGITNAVNLIDGLDGLAGGVILLSCVTLGFVYIGRAVYEPSLLAIILCGGILGFLIYNLPPAKIILGDTGSLSIGLIVSLIPLLAVNQGNTSRMYYLLPLVILLYPITDTGSSFLRRVLKGRNPFQRDKEHFHHRLIHLGFTPVKTLLVLYFVCIYFDLASLIPVYFINLFPHLLYYFFAFIIVSVGFIIYSLGRLEKRAGHSCKQ